MVLIQPFRWLHVCVCVGFRVCSNDCANYHDLTVPYPKLWPTWKNPEIGFCMLLHDDSSPLQDTPSPAAKGVGVSCLRALNMKKVGVVGEESSPPAIDPL